MKKVFSVIAAGVIGALSAVQTFSTPVEYLRTSAADNAVRIDSSGRKMEKLSRGVSAVSTGKAVFISWRSLEEDPQNAAFNVYRITDGVETKLNDSPLKSGTNFTDTTADLAKDNVYTVKMVVNGKEIDDGNCSLNANSTAGCTILPIKTGGTVHFVWVGDFNGDGDYDYLVDRCADDHQKLEAYLSDGTYLYTIDLGVNSENKNNISPGASTIDVGMWDGATVYDIDSDGYAEILLRIADGVTFGDGKKYSSSSGANGQAIAVLDGKTGALKSSINLPEDYLKVGPMACMMEIGYLDGVNPSLICWLKNRNSDKSFNSLMVAYNWKDGKLNQQWKYDNKKGYAEAHQIRVADVNYDGKDEVLHMGYALNSDGTLRYHMDEVVHGDRWYVGAFSADNEGKEMMGYGIQQNNASGLLEYFYNASTGKIIWKNQTTDGSTYDVGRGNIGDIDPTHDGFECYSFQGTYAMDGKKITDKYMYPVIRLWWDGDLLSESYNDGKIEKWNYQDESVSRLATTWKITNCSGSDRGAPMFYGDITGDWREEVVMIGPDNSSLVIISTTTPTEIRNECLAQDPCYRNCMTAKGYYQSHMLDYYLGSGMKTYTFPEPISAGSGKLIKELSVNDMEYGKSWKIAEDVQVGSLIFSDREVTYVQLPKEIIGAENIMTACDSKNTSGEIAEFEMAENATVYIALDSRVNVIPEWLSGWEKTEMTAVGSNDVIFNIYSKKAETGEKINLGANGQSSGCVNYTVFVKQGAGYIMGDVNADGEFDLADLVLMESWLLGKETVLENWKAGNFIDDDKLDVFDFCLMKNAFINK